MKELTSIIIRCDQGHEHTIDLAKETLDWEIVDSDEREMGTETLHEAILLIICCKCREEITVTLHVWEYPEGFFNMDDIEVEGGELVRGCDLGQFVLPWDVE